MKKMVMFGYNMEMGGAERALINVINAVKNEFEIDLILIKAEGSLMKDIPGEVNIRVIRKNLLQYVLFRYVSFFRKKTIRRMTKKSYDVAIAFMEGRAATWLVDMKQTCKKIGWIHNDVNLFDIGISKQEILSTYSKLDEIVVVSEHSKKSFCEKYHIPSEKVKVIYNLIDEETILNKADEFVPEKNTFTFVNVAKMRPQKRHDRLLEAVSILKKEGYSFKVWSIGDGPLQENNRQLAKELDVLDKVEFLGLQENPFPYVKTADWFVMSSDHEGYPLSLLESLLLKTPVITTKVSGADEILQGGKYGDICDVSVDGLVNSMRKVLVGKEDKAVWENLLTYKGSNKEIIEQLKKSFNS